MSDDVTILTCHAYTLCPDVSETMIFEISTQKLVCVPFFIEIEAFWKFCKKIVKMTKSSRSQKILKVLKIEKWLDTNANQWKRRFWEKNFFFRFSPFDLWGCHALFSLPPFWIFGCGRMGVAFVGVVDIPDIPIEGVVRGRGQHSRHSDEAMGRTYHFPLLKLYRKKWRRKNFNFLIYAFLVIKVISQGSSTLGDAKYITVFSWN